MNLITQTAIDHACGYSERPEQLRELLSSLEIAALNQKAENNTAYRLNYRYTIVISAPNVEISFVFHDSIYNFEQHIDVNLCNVLACIGADYYCPDTFEEFCDEYGYNDDSITHRELFYKCKEHTRKLKRIFTDKDIECLPR